MTRRTNSVYLIFFALLATGCYVGEAHQTTIHRQFPADGIRTIKLLEVDGNLNVEAGAPNEIDLVAHVRSRGTRSEPGAENQGYFESRIEGDELRIGQERGRVQIGFPFMKRRDIHIDYTLRVPPTIALDMETINGRIETRGVDGEAELKTVNGTIDVETPGTNELSAVSVNGTVRAKFLQDFRGARLRTVNGGVEALLPQSASFTCDLSQVNGDFEASFPLSIHSNPGGRRVSGAVNGGRYELRIAIVNGDVEVQHLAAPPIPPAPPAIAPPPASSAPSAPSAPPVPQPVT